MYDSNEFQETNPSRHYKVLRKITLDKGLKSESGYEVVDEEPALHYYWQTIKKGQEIEGFVVHSSKVAAIEQLNQRMWFILVIGLGVTLIIISILGSTMTKRYMRPIEAATMTAIELAQGNYGHEQVRLIQVKQKC